MKTSDVRRLAEYLRANRRKCSVCGDEWDNLLISEAGQDTLCLRCERWAYEPLLLEARSRVTLC